MYWSCGRFAQSCLLRGLERQVVGGVAAVLCWWERCLGGVAHACDRLWRSGIEGCGGCGASLIDLAHVVSANIIEPATVVLVSVEVEKYRQFIAGFDVEALQTILAEHIEHHLAGVLIVRLDDEGL